MISRFFKAAWGWLVVYSNRNVFVGAVLSLPSLICGFYIGFTVPIVTFGLCILESYISGGKPFLVDFLMLFVTPLVVYSLLKAGSWMSDKSIDKEIEDLNGLYDQESSLKLLRLSTRSTFASSLRVGAYFAAAILFLFHFFGFIVSICRLFK